MAHKDDQGFKIINGGTLNAKFHLTCNRLRSEAASIGLISHHLYWDENDPPSADAAKRIDRASILTLQQLLQNFEGACETLGDLDETPDENLDALINAIGRERETLIGLAHEARESGQLPWDLIEFAYSKDELAVIETDDARHGAQICRVARHESFFGNFITLSYRFCIHDGRAFRWANASKRIPEFSGFKSGSQIGAWAPSPEETDALRERGERYMEFAQKPSYLAYEGPLTRRNYWSNSRYRAAGRIMCDQRSMREMDPDYDRYYGSVDDDDDEGGFERLEGDMLFCASPYIYGFSFLAKSWGEMLIEHAKPISFRKEAFDRLVLDPSRKRLIEGLVRQNGQNFTDLIEGKGGGCIFLLHGEPGVGKTLTAEAIAERLERPLYMVGAGELGITPDDLEARLKRVLDTAHAWNAVLLIDEADIFLEQRSRADVQRNAMVGIFLRLLEYHQGILFLTTNRVSDIDEAFLSRVSIGLHYGALSETARGQIWRNLLEAAGWGEIEPAALRSLAALPLNGRQIKHCIRLAGACALAEERKPNIQDLADMAQLALEFKQDFAKAHKPDAPGAA